jgi:AcrR family transcriptional regulator
MPRPRSLTDTDIAYAAIAVIDRDGLIGLNMRAVAAELNIATMSIYRYVASREQLEELIVAVLFSEVDLTPPRRSTWRTQIAALVERVRDKVRAHPEVIPLGLPHRQTSAPSLRLSETVFGILARAGFTASQRELGNRTLVMYLLGSLQLEHYGRLSGAGAAQMANLSREEYPMLWASTHRSRSLTSDQEFRQGLEVVLDGLEALLRIPAS